MATEDRFVGRGFFANWQSGLSVGVPGVPRMMEFMHERYGKKKWKFLFKEAEKLARNGFNLTERTSSQVAGQLESLLGQFFGWHKQARPRQLAIMFVHVFHHFRRARNAD